MARKRGTEALTRELVLLCEYIQKMKVELAAIKQVKDQPDHFNRMTGQLDAVTDATATATNQILSSMEIVSSTTAELRGKISSDEHAMLDLIEDQVNQTFEACAFQDITGQRITKIVNSMKYIDERVNSMVSLWGQSNIEAVDLPDSVRQGDEDPLLQGPALENQGVSQEDIDKMFD